MEALQNADYLLTMKGCATVSARRSSPFAGGPNAPPRLISGSAGKHPTEADHLRSQSAQHPLLADIDPVHLVIQTLFEASENLEDSAFQDVDALRKLRSEMISMQSDAMEVLGKGEITDELAVSVSSVGLSPRNNLFHRGRVSGIHFPRTLVSLVCIVWLTSLLIE